MANSDEDILGLVTKLINLAVNEASSSEEARTAALKAVKLIHERGLLGKAADLHQMYTQVRPPPTPKATSLRHPELLKLAREKVSLFYGFLFKEALQGRFTLYKSDYVVSKCLENGTVHLSNKTTFQKQVSNALKKLVKEGKLTSKPRRNGGYGIPKDANLKVVSD